ncbi:U6 snRNA phosphodiesterase [Lachnellula subtilissima]|uniref:U6 snRNA phosphodiesterase n=1 Tax=Lachnellula subtilissima TaxID=602034 RepID=A0A8H8U4V5_9HELO|nr:U6 snRNA phosphodiesterase [Lachnellula subtilissima]
MALVDYPSSDEDEQIGNDQKITSEAATGILKRKRERERERDENESPNDLPPLPSKFHDLYASTSRVSTRDDPSLHGGRKRVTPHIEGNWPTHLYIEWYPATAEYESLSKIISKLKGLPLEEASELHSFLTSDLGAPLPLHISLSRPIGFGTEQKEDFVTSLKSAMESSGIRPFEFAFSGLDWVANFENTRWFLVLRIQKPEFDSLNKLLHVCNTVVQDYGQPSLYAKATSRNTTKSTKWHKQETSKNRSSAESSKAYWSNLQDFSGAFHISIAWTLASPSEDLLALTKSIAIDDFQDVAQTRVNIQEIKAKVGNAVANMPLHANIQEATGLFSF